MQEVFRVRMNDEGRLVIPAVCRKMLGMTPGEELLLKMTKNAIEITTFDRAVDEFQRQVQELFGSERSLADELIAERRAEAAKEAHE